MKKFLLAFTILIGVVSASALTKVVTTIDGQPETRDLEKITFDGNNALLHFSDLSIETVEMHRVAVVLTEAEQTAVNQILSDSEKPKGVYNLKGQRIGDSPEECIEPGIYIVNGKKVLVK